MVVSRRFRLLQKDAKTQKRFNSLYIGFKGHYKTPGIRKPVVNLRWEAFLYYQDEAENQSRLKSHFTA